jgi:hypothetical protein
LVIAIGINGEIETMPVYIDLLGVRLLDARSLEDLLN